MPENADIIVSNEMTEKVETTGVGKEDGDDVKTVEKQPEEKSTVTLPSYDLSKFQLTRILQNNTMRKTITLLGTFPDVSTTDEAIVLFEKQAFRERDVQTQIAANGTADSVNEIEGDADDRGVSFFSEALQVRKEFINNIYGSFQCIPPVELSGIKTTVVYPATEKHIEKYSITQKFLINETPALYEQLTLPHITGSQFTLDWVYNILEHKQETERIVYEDADPEMGFVLLPDLKWDGKTMETLYLLAIVHKHGIKSLRDLNASHLPLLRNMRARIAEVVEQRYGLTGAQLRMYFHYQPSFYHLHLHINPVRGDAPGIWCEKAHLLETVINNLELLPDYYQRATLPFVLFEGNKLLEQYEQQQSLRKPTKHQQQQVDDDGGKEEKLEPGSGARVAADEEKQVEESDEAAREASDVAEDLTMPPQKKLKLANE